MNGTNAQRSDLIRHARQFQGPNGCVGQPCASPNCKGVCDHPYSEFCAVCDVEEEFNPFANCDAVGGDSGRERICCD